MTTRLAGGVSATETAYGMVLLDERSGDYWQLNGVAAIIVRTLAAGGGAAEAVERITAEFDVDQEQAHRDVSDLIDELRTAKLVTR